MIATHCPTCGTACSTCLPTFDNPVRSIALPWARPPLSLNDRRHWRVHDHERREVLTAARWAIRAERLGSHRRIETCLHWRPARNGRRDEDNPVATAKHVFDALVLEGVVPDDTPAHMRKLMPELHPAEPGMPGKVWLTVQVLE